MVPRTNTFSQVKSNDAPFIICVNRTHKGKAPKPAPKGWWEAHTTSFDIEAHTIDTLADDVIRQGYAIAPVHHTRRQRDNFLYHLIIGLDFDTEDERSSLDTLCAAPFTAKYGALVHTTSSHAPDAPRGRVLFRLDVPIKDPDIYERYVIALVRHFGLAADPQCKDAARLFYGAVDCEIRKLYNVLPVAVLHELVAQQDAEDEAERQRQQEEKRKAREERGTRRDSHGTLDSTEAPATPRDADGLLDWAIREARPHKRNKVGFKLACRMRDAHISKSDAWAVMQQYQMAVTGIHDHPYEMKGEAEPSLNQAYRREPRSHQMTVADSEAVDNFLWLVYHARIGIKQGDIHTTFKVAIAVADKMVTAHTIQHVHMPLRSFNAYNIPKTTAMAHLAILVEGGLLQKVKKSDRMRATAYSLNAGQVENLIHSPVLRTVDRPHVDREAYNELQSMAMFVRGAHIDTRLWPKGKELPPSDGWGPAAVKIVAALNQYKLCTDGTYYAVRGSEKRETALHMSHLCIACETPITSIADLVEATGVSRRKAVNVCKTLNAIGVIGFEYGANNAKVPYLTDDWYERLAALEPYFTSYGHKELRALENAQQQDRQHEWTKGKAEGRLERARNPDGNYAQRTQADIDYLADQLVKAPARKEEAQRGIDACNERRRQLCKANGLPFVHVSLRPQAPRQKQQESRVNGRNMGKDSNLRDFDPADFAGPDEARNHLDKILSHVNPTDSMKERAGALSEHWGFPSPTWQRQELNA